MPCLNPFAVPSKLEVPILGYSVESCTFHKKCIFLNFIFHYIKKYDTGC